MQYKNFTNRADLLEAAAHSIRMQEKAGEANPKCKEEYCGSKVRCISELNFRAAPNIYEFPLAVVEGKPVFEGDELWNVPNNFKFKVKSIENEWCGVKPCLIGEDNRCGWVEDCSWNPPKPKTIMVELTVEQAELGEKLGLTTDIASACRKALEAAK